MKDQESTPIHPVVVSASSGTSAAPTPPQPQCDPIPEFLKSQLQQAIETYRVQLTLVVQLLIGLSVVNATIIGYALTTRLAGVFWVGALFPALMFATSRTVAHLSRPIILVAISIEHRYSPAWHEGLMTAFVSSSMPPSVAREIIARARQTDRQLSEPTKVIPAVTAGTGRGFVKAVFVVACILQLIAPFIFAKFFGWRIL